MEGKLIILCIGFLMLGYCCGAEEKEAALPACRGAASERSADKDKEEADNVTATAAQMEGEFKKKVELESLQVCKLRTKTLPIIKVLWVNSQWTLCSATVNWEYCGDACPSFHSFYNNVPIPFCMCCRAKTLKKVQVQFSCLNSCSSPGHYFVMAASCECNLC